MSSTPLEDELGLPSLVDIKNEERTYNFSNVESRDLQKVDETSVDEHEDDVDEIYEMAIEASKNLIDFGYGMEPKNAGANAFMPAAKMLEIALKASQSKTDRKMEKIRLTMEQDKHKSELNSNTEDGEIIESGNSIIANRNDLLAKIRSGEIT